MNSLLLVNDLLNEKNSVDINDYLSNTWNSVWSDNGNFNYASLRLLKTVDKINNLTKLGVDFKNKKILDIGCGNGTTLLFLRKFFNVDGLGVDISSHAIDKLNNDMSKKSIEVELRAEVLMSDVDNLKKILSERGKILSSTKRLSVMYFGKINEQKTDIRIRITNGECEVAAKFGSFGSHDRLELSQKIEKEQFFGMIKIFSQFKFNTEIGERETINYKLPDNIIISLVLAKNIAYIELEKMSVDSEVFESKIKLQRLADDLNLQILDEEKFDILCKKLSDEVDWPFNGLDSEYLKLENIFKTYIK